MAKKKHSKRSGVGFAVFSVVWAVLLLTATGFGLYWLWGCMEGYEASRPHIAIDKYMSKITKEYIIDHSEELLSKVDFNIQSREDCAQIVMDALEGEISYARKASACTEDKQVYVVRWGKQVVGSFTIVAAEADAYGFRPWIFQEEQYGLSDLMGTETVTIRAPEGYSVMVNGYVLDESYIVSSETAEYDVFEDYYEDYDLPKYVMHTYEAGPFLNAVYEPEVYSPQGQSVVLDENFVPYSLIPELEEGEREELESFLAEFLDVYVIFAGCANDNRQANYWKVRQYVVPDSKLAERMLEALAGLQYAKSHGDEVADIDIHHLYALSEDAYLFDVTYYVDTIGQEGLVRTTSNARMVIIRSADKLLVESMIGY